MKATQPKTTTLFGFFLSKAIRRSLAGALALGAGAAFTTVSMAQEAPKSGGSGGAAPAAAPSGIAGLDDKSTGSKKNVLSFEKADLRLVLTAMAKQANMSLIIPDDVTGTVTARFVDIPLDKAMRTILESKGYSLVEADNIYQVKSSASVSSEPTKMEVYQFANGSAKESKATVDKLLTKNGNCQIDDRSNTLIITDSISNLPKILAILKTLDTEIPQVLIETKLMEMTRNPTERIGVDWASLGGYSITASVPTGTTSDGQPGSGSTGVRLGLTRSGDPGAIGSTGAGRAGGILTPATLAGQPYMAVLTAPAFTTTLSFLLNDNDTELIGSPRVITADNKEATITVATQEPIPNFTFNQQTASFVISGFEYKAVGNILKVTPHVNKDHFVTLDVQPSVSTSAQNGRTFALPGGSVTIPLISVRDLTTRVRVKTGNTLALGGLMENNENRTYSKVPFLGDIPGIGELFRSHAFIKTKRNLLVFITPTIISGDAGSGLEDQYSMLKELENDRFAYRKSFTGNAKPRDQFHTLPANAELVPVRSGAVRSGKAAELANAAPSPEVMDDAAQENLIDAQLMIKQAESLFSNNDYAAALTVCQDAEKKLAKIPEASAELDRIRQYQSLCLSNLAAQSFEAKDYNQAVTLSRRAYQLDPKNREAYEIFQKATQASGQSGDLRAIEDENSTKSDALEKATTEKEQSSDVKQEQLTPRLSPGLRE